MSSLGIRQLLDDLASTLGPERLIRAYLEYIYTLSNDPNALEDVQAFFALRQPSKQLNMGKSKTTTPQEARGRGMQLLGSCIGPKATGRLPAPACSASPPTMSTAESPTSAAVPAVGRLGAPLGTSGRVPGLIGQPLCLIASTHKGFPNGRLTVQFAIPDISKVKCNECHKTRHYARDFWSKTKGGSIQPNRNLVSKNYRRAHRGAQRGTGSPTKGDDSKVEGRISLSKAQFDENESWAGLTVGNEPVASAEPTHGLYSAFKMARITYLTFTRTRAWKICTHSWEQ